MLSQEILYKSRTSLMNAIYEANNKLVELGWKITDDKATREDALKICELLSEAIASNSADTLQDMQDKNVNQVN